MSIPFNCEFVVFFSFLRDILCLSYLVLTILNGYLFIYLLFFWVFDFLLIFYVLILHRGIFFGNFNALLFNKKLFLENFIVVVDVE